MPQPHGERIGLQLGVPLDPPGLFRRLETVDQIADRAVQLTEAVRRAGGDDDDVARTNLAAVTADACADLQPAWSPDGRTIAFATDRVTTTLGDRRFGAVRVGLLALPRHECTPAEGNRS